MKKTTLGSKLYTALVFLFLYAPIAVLIIFSFNSGYFHLTLAAVFGFLKAFRFIGIKSFSTMQQPLPHSRTQ